MQKFRGLGKPQKFLPKALSSLKVNSSQGDDFFVASSEIIPYLAKKAASYFVLFLANSVKFSTFGLRNIGNTQANFAKIDRTTIYVRCADLVI